MDTFKYFDIVLDSSLTFNDHLQYLEGKLYSKIKLLGRVRWLLDRSTTLTVYKTLMLHIIDYGVYIYLGTSAKNRETLQKLPNYAFRLILNTDKYGCTKDRHASLNMDMLDSR